MVKHILVATDGSKLSDRAVAAAIGLARSAGAKLTAFHATEDFPIMPYPEYSMLVDALTPDLWQADQEKRALHILRGVEARARKAGVPCVSKSRMAAHPYKAILEAAKKSGCDLIVMASHGRRGVQGLVLGSETNKVLTHGKLPVLVVR